MSDSCKVVFYGELQTGFEPDQVVEAFSKKFSVSREKAEKLIKAGKDVVLKGGLNQERAEKYKKVLERIGLVVRIEGKGPELSTSALALEPIESEQDEATLVMDADKDGKAIDTCPKCGSDNMSKGSCMDCGVVAEKYLAIKARMAEQEDQDEWQAETENPYHTPQADLMETAEGEMNGPHSVPAGHGWAWLVKGWWHFKRNPAAWILAVVVWILFAIVIGLVPLLGGIVINLLTPVIMAGFVIGCRAQDDGEDFTVGHVFAGFSSNAGQLILSGVIYFGAIILLSIVMMAGMFSMLGLNAMAAQNPEMMAGTVLSPGFLIMVLVGLLLMVPVMMAYLFAPMLIALDDIKALTAMKLSFIGSLKNLLPLTLYGLLAMLLLFIGSLPFMLGLLIVIPLLTAALYSAYRDIYYDRA